MNSFKNGLAIFSGNELCSLELEINDWLDVNNEDITMVDCKMTTCVIGKEINYTIVVLFEEETLLNKNSTVFAEIEEY